MTIPDHKGLSDEHTNSNRLRLVTVFFSETPHRTLWPIFYGFILLPNSSKTQSTSLPADLQQIIHLSVYPCGDQLYIAEPKHTKDILSPFCPKPSEFTANYEI